MPQEQPIQRAFFRETEDGTTVFFPWGLPHRGYELTDNTARRKAYRAASFLVGSTIGIGAWAAYQLEPILESEATGLTGVVGALAAPGAALLVVLLSYAYWVSRFVERFPESDLQVSREERLREAAEFAKPWKVSLVGGSLCGLSLLLSWLQPRAWWLGLLGVMLGVGLLLWSSFLKRAAAGPRL